MVDNRLLYVHELEGRSQYGLSSQGCGDRRTYGFCDEPTAEIDAGRVKG